MNKQTGVALVIVLWVLSLLTLMAASFALTMRRETTITATIRDQAIADALAESGIKMAQQMLLLDKSQRWRADGSLYQFKLQQASIRVKILSERGKIDVNKSDKDLLEKAIARLDIDNATQQKLIDAILDWRDADDLQRINGAEKDQYLAEGLNYGPANRPFVRLEELQKVLGMTPEIYQQLKPLLTVYNLQASVDLNVADKATLLAVTGLDEQLIEDYLKKRVENHRLGLEAPPLPGGAVGNTSANATANATYQVISQAKTDTGQEAAIQVVIQKTQTQDNPFVTLEWRRLYDYPAFFSEAMDNKVINNENGSE